MPNLADLLFRTVDGVFAVDAEQRIIFWNPGCAQLFGIPAQDAIGRPCGELVRGRDPSGRPFCVGGCCVARLTEGERAPRAFPLRARDAQGNELRLTVNIVLVPSRHADRWTCVHLLHRGEALDALEAMACGGPDSRSAGRRKSVHGARIRAKAAALLTPREQEILRLLAEGLTVATISNLLNVSRVTVRNHIQHIQGKLGVHSQVETVAYAYRHNLV